MGHFPDKYPLSTLTEHEPDNTINYIDIDSFLR
jgi:hypothetical protein